ncbi:Ubiquitin-conjugating enzyme E2 6 [Pleurotus ostreatus]|uniref:Ubiquitin-conjugating enzyme E2 6 n=1 Tax=Pleurotus ostreatus TaxID=5322 RepID=A0A8H6ZXU4_PLEOS|nr:Ubiquitin-conjugating enzyme E2 6 [Pleurotus ostreatus]KAF7430662.1 Ubiquitin-conjugating enzyme E2 6 [Pleurotus ostreatus]
MASKAAQKRLTKEYLAMQKESPPFVWAVPDEKNILTWNFIIRGPPDSPFTGGEYHGVLLFPSEYPFKPPGIKMFTPSGRFQPDKKICFSMSDFHPGTWNPAWSVATILTGLLSFMLSDEMTTGSVTSTDGHKRTFAQRSHAWNVSQQRFKDAFPEYCGPEMRDLPNMGEKERGKPVASPVLTFTSSTPIMPSTSSAMIGHNTLLKLNPPTNINNPFAPPNPSNPNRADLNPRIPGLNTNSIGKSGLDKSDDSNHASWAATWGRVFWEKWRWGAVIVLAVVLSRFSSST